MPGREGNLCSRGWIFEEVVTLQAAYAPAHTAISNALQTNGTLITDKWAALFRKYQFF
ncbi:hypothetical protein ACFTAO_23885 [Paenibacillus rhizoplanae]